MPKVLHRDYYRERKIILLKTNKTKTDLDLKQKEEMSCTHMNVMGNVQKKMHRWRTVGATRWPGQQKRPEFPMNHLYLCDIWTNAANLPKPQSPHL